MFRDSVPRANAVACFAIDGNTWDDDAAADGTVTINVARSVASNAATYDCTATSFHITASGTLTLQSNLTTGAIAAVNFSDLTIDSGGKISSDSQGCSGGGVGQSGYGPNPSNVCVSSGSGYGDGNSQAGAGHGGRGGALSSSYTGGAVYDSAIAPALFGAGGGGSNYISGGNGGGLVRLNVSGSFTVDGTVSANGAAGGSATNAGGGGSGGSVYITAGTVVGTTGVIQAKGGNGGSGTGNGGGGGGGRVAVVYGTATHSFASTDFIVVGGAKGGGTATDGAKGTVYVKDTTNNDVTIYHGFSYDNTAWTAHNWISDPSATNQYCTSAAVTPSVTASNSLTFGGSLTCSAAGLTSFNLSAGTAFAVSANSTVDTSAVRGANITWTIPVGNSQTWSGLTVNGSVQGLFSVASATGITLTGGTQINANAQWTNLTDLTVDSGSGINATGKGCVSQTSTANGYGPTAGNVCTQTTAGYGTGGNTGSSGSGGGGYGGVGGAGSTRAGGATYGSAPAPALFGGSGGGEAGNFGGSGGGYVRLNVTGTFTHNGSVAANGAVGAAGTSSSAAGGGSGGSVYVTADTMAGTTGTFAAAGGAGGSSTGKGGGGGGGRIAVFYWTDSSSYLSGLTAVANAAGGAKGGTGASDGSVGTLNADVQICGDGEQDPGEQCDDGNTASGDGCSSSCQVSASGWSLKKTITVNHTKVSGTQTDFPVLLASTTLMPAVYQGAKTDGADIIFTSDSAGTTVIPSEIVAWDKNARSSQVWVKLPSLNASTDTTFYVWYGNSSASMPASWWTDGRNAVWSNGFGGVWHFEENPAGTAPQLADSTGNGNLGTSSGTMTTTDLVAARAGNGLDMDNTDDKILVSDAATLEPGSASTLSVWVKPRSCSATDRFIARYDGAGYDNGSCALDGYDGTTNGCGIRDWFQNGTTLRATGTSGDVMTINDWYYAAGTFSSGALTAYVNGVQKSTGSATETSIADIATTWSLGGDSGGTPSTYAFDGIMDEARISTVARSAGWLLTEYNDQNAPADFFISVCGDGAVAAGEQCDDGNAANGDGCSSSCQVSVSGWTLKKTVTIDHTKVTGANASFPVFLGDRAFPNSLYSGTRTDGSDLFISSDSAGANSVPFEVVSWNSTAKTAQVWVKAPSIDATTDVPLYVWYGNTSAIAPGVTATNGRNAVWNSYSAVWHLEENPAGGTVNDATVNANTGAPNANMATSDSVAGAVGQAMNFNNNGVITVPHSSSLNLNGTAMSVEAWARSASLENSDTVLMKASSSSWADGYGMFNNTSTLKFYVTSYSANVSGSSWSTGIWKHVAGVYDGANVRLYQNGVAAAADNYTGSVTTNTSPLLIGNGAGVSYYWNGTIDEVRIAPVARTAGWLLTEYSNQSDPSHFVYVCGNGIINSNEACDDGNETAGDGCSAVCASEAYWHCSGEPSSCVFIPEPPTATADSYTAYRNYRLTAAVPGVLENDVTPPGYPMTAVKVTDPAHGALNLSADGSFTYDATTDYLGADSFTYKARNVTGDSLAVTVSLSVQATPPTAYPDSYSTPFNTHLSVSAPGMLGNDLQNGGLNLTAVVLTYPAHGSLNASTDGSFTYDATTDYYGADSFTYKAHDSVGDSSAATVSIQVFGPPPTAVADAYDADRNGTLTVTAGYGVLANDSTPTGYPMTAIKVSDPTHGSLDSFATADGSFVYHPATNYLGPDSFSYLARNSIGDSAIVDVNITVLPTPPTAYADPSYTTPFNTRLSVAAPGVLANDTQNGGLNLTAVVLTYPAHGSLNASTDGSFTYDATTDYYGADSFTYKAHDSAGYSGAATASILVYGPPPAATTDAYSTGRNYPVTVTAPGVLANDTSPTGYPMTAVLVTGPSYASSFSFNADGSFSYTPTADFMGSDQFTYKAHNSIGDSDTVTVAISVNATVPTASADSYAVLYLTQLSVAAPGVLANDTQNGGLNLTAVVLTYPAHGSLNASTDGSFTYDATTDYYGADSFTYKAHDSAGYSGAATVSFTIMGPPPTAADDSYSASRNFTLTVTAGSGLLVNDHSNGGTGLTAQKTANPGHGTVTVNADGSFTYTPTSGYLGADSFTYKDQDSFGYSSVATVDITMSPTPPIPAADSYTVYFNTRKTVAAPGVLGNDVMNGGTGMTAVLASGPSHGALTLNADGSFTYDATTDYQGADLFRYRAYDSAGYSATVDVNLTVYGPPPTADNDAYSAYRNYTLTTDAPGVLANDTHGGTGLTAVKLSDVSHGRLTLSSNGSFTYTPAADYTGADSFTYRAHDTHGDSAAATVDITIVNTPAIAVADSYVAVYNTQRTVAAPGVLANDRLNGGTGLTAEKVADPVRGTLNAFGSDGSFTYTPPADYYGPDSFTYRAHDSLGYSSAATVSISVNGPPPTGTADSYGTGANVVLTVAAGSGVLANDHSDGGTGLAAYKLTNPGHGTLDYFYSSGAFRYTPSLNFASIDSFTYLAADSYGSTDAVTVTISVAPRLPTAVGESYAIPYAYELIVAAPGVLANDSANAVGGLTAAKLTDPAHGTLVEFNANGSFRYTPTAGYYGADLFTYRVINIAGSVPATADITIQPPPATPLPVARADSYTTTYQTDLTVAAPGVLANDASPGGSALSAEKVNDPAHGTLTLSSNGGFTYSPEDGWYGSDSFTYDARNANGLSASPATVLITVPSPAIIGVANSYTTVYETELLVYAPGVLGNDSDPLGGTLTTLPLTNPSHGTLDLGEDGSLLYVPADGWWGTDRFTYRARSANGTSSAITVTISVTGPLPVVFADSYEADFESLLTVATPGVLNNDHSPVGHPITAVIATQPTHGTLDASTDGSFTYQPAAGWIGYDSFTYKARDAALGDSAAALVMIRTLSQRLNVRANAYVTNYQQTLPVASPGVLGNDTLSGGGSLTASKLTDPAHGTLNYFNSDGSFRYTPADGWWGSDSFDYEAIGPDSSDSATVSLTVLSPLPRAYQDSYRLSFGGTAVVSAPGVLTNDVSPVGNQMIAVKLSEPSHGTVNYFNADGSFKYTPAANWFGLDIFSYKAQDALGDSSTQYVRVSTDPPPAPPGATATADSYTMPGNSTLVLPAPGVLDNDSSPEGLPLKSRLVHGPSHGYLGSFGSDGSFIYTANQDWFGADSFTYSAYDDYGSSSATAVSISVQPVPVAAADSYSTSAGTTLVVAAPGLLGNDTDPNSLPMTAVRISDPAHGTITAFDGDGSFTYVPASNYTGADFFTYKARDTVGYSALTTVSLTVTGGAPSAAGNGYSVLKNGRLTVAAPGLLSNDTDPGNLPLTAVRLTGPAHGALTVNADGSFEYAPSSGYYGSDFFTYQAHNGALGSVPSTVDIVISTNDPTLWNRAPLSRLKTDTDAVVTLSFMLQNTLSGTAVITFPAGFTVSSAFAAGTCSDSGTVDTFTVDPGTRTLTAMKHACAGMLVLTGATVVNPSTP